MLTRRTHVLLDDERYERLRRQAEERGTSIGALIREAVDRAFPAVPPARQEAGRRLLEADPMEVGDWPQMKRELLDARSSGISDDA